MADNLLPCPFCYGEPRVMHCGACTYMVQCLQCKATTDDGCLDRISANWNRRDFSPMTIAAAVMASATSAGWEGDEKLTVEEAWTILCETPDITSPEEYPDHALITLEQLGSFMARAAAPSAKGAS